MPALAGVTLVLANMVRPTRKKILLIDDDEKLGDLLKSYLAQFDMNVTAATHPDEGLRLVPGCLHDALDVRPVAGCRRAEFNGR